MSTALRLVVFDVDGTLVDSQAHILAAMTAAFSTLGHPPPSREAVLSIVGLSLHRAMPVLAPDAADNVHLALERNYKQAYTDLRQGSGASVSSPLYPGTRHMLDALSAEPETLLGVATGKSARGLDALIAAHDLEGMFMTRQVADFHPSKPHPSMIHTAMTDAGVTPEQTVMIGDTTFDMHMAQAAGVPFLGVGWGYHPSTALTWAAQVLQQWSDLPAALDRIGRSAA